MARSIQDILNYTSLSKAVLRTAGLPNPFPEEFMSNTEDVIGNVARYRLEFSQRKSATYNTYGAKAREFQLVDVGDASVKLVHNFMSVTLGGMQGPILWNQLQSMDAYTRDTALGQLRHQIEQFGKTFGNHRIYLLARMLLAGVAYYDINGNPLPSSSNAFYTVSNNVNANNQNQLNGVLGTSWKLANTNIPLAIELLKKRTKRLSGLPVEVAMYGENLCGYLATNQYVAEYLARNEKFRDVYLDAAGTELPAGFLGIPEWRYVADAFYTDSTGTNQDLWTADAVTFCPRPKTGGWHSCMQGTYWCPSTLSVFSDGVAAMDSLKPVQGMFSFAQILMNPPSAVHFAGDTHLHCFKTPDAIFQGTVAF